MRSWVLSIIGISSLAGALTAPAIGQGGATTPPTPKPVVSQDARTFKEVKFKMEWTVKSLAASAANASPDSEAITITTAEGQTVMTSNPIPGDSDKYRRITLHSELQADGTYLVNVGVLDILREQDIQRLDTVVRVHPGETKVIQDRISKGSNYNYQYQVLITPVTD